MVVLGNKNRTESGSDSGGGKLSNANDIEVDMIMKEKPRKMIAEQVREQQERARRALEEYFDAMMTIEEDGNADICYDCESDTCDKNCEWYDLPEAGFWVLLDDEHLKRAYKAAVPLGNTPFRLSRALDCWITKGMFVPYVSGDSLLHIIDEWDNVGLTYCFSFFGRDMSPLDHDHEHFFDSVLHACLCSPNIFYIPKKYVGQYSEQEIQLLDQVREHACRSIGKVPAVPIVYDASSKDEPTK